MDQLTAYSVMIVCLPIIPWILKLTVSYRIRYIAPTTPKRNIGKFYKKAKIPFIRRFFYIDVKRYVHPFLYWGNFAAGCLLLLCVSVSLIYGILAICRHRLVFLKIPVIAAYFVLAVTVIVIIIGILERINEKSGK